jgi:3-oxoacyl-[acyl-carrier-protein] synthase-3
MTVKAYIRSTGHYLPERVVPNQFFVDHFADTDTPTSDEWIRERTGIERRHWVSDHESTATISTLACQNALEMAGLEPDDIDLIVVGTASPERLFPSTACFIQEALGAKNFIPGFDLTAACSGFQFAATTAAQFIKAGTHKNVLAVGAETLSRIVDMNDRGSSILFGDGAGAVVISSEEGHEILGHHMSCDGNRGDFITRRLGSRYPATVENLEAGHQYLSLQGREVYKVVVNLLPQMVKDSVAEAGLEMSDLKWILCHQMNLRIMEAASKRLDIPMDQFLVNIQDTGNTSSASVPILLDQANRAGKLQKGDLIAIAVFGGGLTWGSLLVRW